jgi:hypothetical protein
MENPAWSNGGEISSTDKCAWLENNGWINFHPTHGSVTGHSTYFSGYAWAENIGWVRLGLTQRKEPVYGFFARS